MGSIRVGFAWVCAAQAYKCRPGFKRFAIEVIPDRYTPFQGIIMGLSLARSKKGNFFNTPLNGR